MSSQPVDAQPAKEVYTPRRQIFNGPGHLSVSQIHAIQENSWHWFLERVARIPRTPAWALVGGKAFHSLSERLDHSALNDDWITDRNEVAELWEQFLGSAIKEELERTDVPVEEWKASGRASSRWPEKENRAFWEEMGTTWAMNYINWRLNNPSWEIAEIDGKPAIELEIGGTFKGAGLPLVGYIDRVFHHKPSGDFMVVDLKSGTRTPADTLQLGTYSLFLDLMHGIRPRLGSFWMARTGSTSVPVDLHTEWPHGRLEHEIRSAESIIRNSALSCNVGGFALYNDAAEHCYACNGIKEDTLLPWEVDLRIPKFLSA